jgi:hypothetical protein
MIWLSEGTSGRGRVLGDKDPLIVGESYNLHLQVQPLEEDQGDQASQAESGEEEKKLTAVLFAPETDFELKRKIGTLTLPGHGPSNPIRRSFKPLRAGRYQIRAGIYYGNVLLQSVVVEANVAGDSAQAAALDAAEDKPAIARLMDYVASADLTALDELPQPDLSIFTNRAADGTHWIGVYKADVAELRFLHTFEAAELAAKAKVLRECLVRIEGSKGAYKFANPLPVDEEGKLRTDDDKFKRREKNLVALAVRGRIMYDALFFSRQDARERRRQLLKLDGVLQSPGIVSVAICRGQSPTFPWAALYARYLDTGREDEIRLCGELKARLADNKWSDTDDKTELIEKHKLIGDRQDLLDKPEICCSKQECPHNGDNDGLIVCPFGFWGLLHQVEQPLQYIQPTPTEKVFKILEKKAIRVFKGRRSDKKSKEPQNPYLNQTSFLECPRDGDVRIVFGAYPYISDAKEHCEEMRDLGPDKASDVTYRPKVTYQDNRHEMVKLMRQGGHHLYYFYCHGQIEDGVFKLKLGPYGRPRDISAADLDPWISWSEAPLVILNACESTVVTPEEIHGFLGKLGELGASGIVGSEIRVWSRLARPVGYQLVKRILEGQSVGETFLEIRRHLLRQCNPLGLAYSFYSPATLHLHDPGGCAWCQAAHPPKRAPGGSS